MNDNNNKNRGNKGKQGGGEGGGAGAREELEGEKIEILVAEKFRREVNGSGEVVLAGRAGERRDGRFGDVGRSRLRYSVCLS